MSTTFLYYPERGKIHKWQTTDTMEVNGTAYPLPGRSAMLPLFSLAQLKFSPYLLRLPQTIPHHKKTEGLQEVCSGPFTTATLQFCFESPLSTVAVFLTTSIFKSKLLRELLPVAVMRSVKQEQRCNNISL